MSKNNRCHWCGDPATATITLDNIKQRLCDNCTLEAESDFTTVTVSKD